jgi:Bacterial TSP3 repeat
LPAPPNPDDIKINDKLPPRKGDTDVDGIPDRVEVQWGSNPNKADSETDTDGDGFANIYEYKNKTHGGRPKSHPPLYLRLYVQDVRRTLLDIRLKKVTAVGPDKNDWDVQVNIKGGRKSTFMAIGDTIMIDNKRYKLTDIKVIKKKIQERSVVVDQDISEITLKSLKGDDTIVAVRNQDVYSSKPQAVLIDELDGKEYKVEQGAILTIGSLQTNRERYLVLKVDPAKEEVFIKNLKALKYLRKGTKCRITKILMIPKIRKEVETSPDGMGEEGMLEDPAMMDPSIRKNRRKSRNRRPGEPLI